MNRYSESYLDEVVETQGKLFDEVQTLCPGIDSSAFIHDYMMSKTRRAIDEGQAYVSTMNEEQLWKRFLEQEQYKPVMGDVIPGFIPDWIGQFYAYYQWYYAIPSSQVVKDVPVEYLTAAYHGLHDLDLELAVRKVGKTKAGVVG